MGRKKKEENRLQIIKPELLEKDIIAYSTEFQFKYLNEKIFKKWTLLDKHVFAAFLTCIDWQGKNPSVIEVNNEYISKRLGWNFSKGQESRIGTYLRECFQHISEHSTINLYDYDERDWFMEPLILHASGNSSTTKVIFNPHFMSHFERLYERAELENKGFTMLLASDVISMKTNAGLRAEEKLRSFHKKSGIASYKYAFTTMEVKELMGLEKSDYMREKVGEDEYRNFNRSGFEKGLTKALEDINENSILVRILKNKDGSLFKKIKNGRTVIGYELRWQVADVESSRKIVEKKIDIETKKLNDTSKIQTVLPNEVIEIEADYSDWLDPD